MVTVATHDVLVGVRTIVVPDTRHVLAYWVEMETVVRAPVGAVTPTRSMADAAVILDAVERSVRVNLLVFTGGGAAGVVAVGEVPGACATDVGGLVTDGEGTVVTAITGVVFDGTVEVPLTGEGSVVVGGTVVVVGGGVVVVVVVVGGVGDVGVG
ncbi:MAG: hypothetical protein ACKORY_13225, partial [Actinomycetota bacterium]